MFGNWFSKSQKTNDRQPPAAVLGTAGPPSSWPTTYAALAELSYDHLNTLMFAQNCVWKHDNAKTWHVDMTVGTITWQFHDKVVRATGQLLGSWYNGRFLWGWAHPSAPPGTAVAATAVKGYADRHGIAELQAAQPDVSFEDSWKLVAVAALIGGLQGVYRGPSGSHGTWAYIGFGPISIANDVGNLGPIRRNTVPPGLDFSSVDSREKADALVRKGELAVINLFPLQLGGQDFPVNQVFVPPHVVALKDRSDNMVAALFDEGKVSSFTASPTFKHDSSSVVPCVFYWRPRVTTVIPPKSSLRFGNTIPTRNFARSSSRTKYFERDVVAVYIKILFFVLRRRGSVLDGTSFETDACNYIDSFLKDQASGPIDRRHLRKESAAN